jgi:hypothetical protein
MTPSFLKTAIQWTKLGTQSSIIVKSLRSSFRGLRRKAKQRRLRVRENAADGGAHSCHEKNDEITANESKEILGKGTESVKENDP